MSNKKQEEFEEKADLPPEEPEVVEAAESEVGNEDPETDASAEASEDSSEVGKLLKRLDEAEEEAKANKERYLRTVADLENFRRRVAKEKDDLRDFAVASVIEDLLPAMDNLRLGLQAADNHPEAKDVAYGFRMVADQLKKTLESYGLVEEDPTGGIFDPNLHDCMSHQAHKEVAEGDVIQTVRSGYRLKKRLLRAASVVVSSGPASGEEEES